MLDLHTQRFKSMKLLTSQAFCTRFLKRMLWLRGVRSLMGVFGWLVVHFVLYCAGARKGELNCPEPPRERFCSRVWEHLPCFLGCKVLVSLSPINTSGNLSKEDEKSIIWSGDFDTGNCMVFTFPRGIPYQEGLRPPPTALLRFAFANRSLKRFNAQHRCSVSCQTFAASSVSMLERFGGTGDQSQRVQVPFSEYFGGSSLYM